MSYERKIINDPVFGFINIPKGLLYDLVCHPLLQRLTRIRQLGLSSVVYPGAQHTRFQHSLGAFYLMTEAIQHLTAKGNFIFDSEAEAVKAAILMHDIGHGPFSHVLEDTIVRGVSHEDISLLLMERINREMNGQLTLAMLPDPVRMIRSAMRSIALFSPDEAIIDDIRARTGKVLEGYTFDPVFYDVTMTGRRLWVSIYFTTSHDLISFTELELANAQMLSELQQHYENCFVELIPDVRADPPRPYRRPSS